jgi:hypothetical protein
VAPLQAVSNNTQRVLQLERPRDSKEYATKQGLCGTVNTLFRQLDRAKEELFANFARMTLADKENGRIRQKLYVKQKGKTGYTHLKTGARIMTAPEQLDARVCKEDRRKAFKDLKPILNVLQKTYNKFEAEREEAEMAKVRAAEDEVKAAENGVDKTEKEKERAKRG